MFSNPVSRLMGLHRSWCSFQLRYFLRMNTLILPPIHFFIDGCRNSSSRICLTLSGSIMLVERHSLRDNNPHNWSWLSKSVTSREKVEHKCAQSMPRSQWHRGCGKHATSLHMHTLLKQHKGWKHQGKQLSLQSSKQQLRNFRETHFKGKKPETAVVDKGGQVAKACGIFQFLHSVITNHYHGIRVGLVIGLALANDFFQCAHEDFLYHSWSMICDIF